MARKKISPKEALKSYWLRLEVSRDAFCALNTVAAALRGTPTRQRSLRAKVLASLDKFGVDTSTLRGGDK